MEELVGLIKGKINKDLCFTKRSRALDVVDVKDVIIFNDLKEGDYLVGDLKGNIEYRGVARISIKSGKDDSIWELYNIKGCVKASALKNIEKDNGEYVRMCTDAIIIEPISVYER